MNENINKNPTNRDPRKKRVTSTARNIASRLIPRASRTPEKEATAPPSEQSIEHALLEDIHDAQTRVESDRPIVAEFRELVKMRDAVLAQEGRYGRLGRSKVVKEDDSAMLWRDSVTISLLPIEFKVLGSRARDPFDEDLYVRDLGGSPVHGGTVKDLIVTRETSSNRAKTLRVLLARLRMSLRLNATVYSMMEERFRMSLR